MLEGIVCIKKSGKERNRYCVIIEQIDDKFVIIDGFVKRRRCNIKHLKLLEEKIKLRKNLTSKKIRELLKEKNFFNKEKIKIKEKIKKFEEKIKEKKKKNDKRKKEKN